MSAPVDRDELVDRVTELVNRHGSLVDAVRSLLDGVEEADLVRDEFVVRVDGRLARDLRRLTSGP